MAFGYKLRQTKKNKAMTIEDILSREEGQTFDRKSIRIKPKDLAVTIIAFANADGGDLVLGITDGKKEIEGVDDDQKVLNEIRRTPFDFCIPSVNTQVEMLPCVDRTGKDNHVLVFHIEPSMRVYANQADEVFLRVGDKSKKLSFDERFQLMNDKGQTCYEETAVYNAELSDIDMTLVDDYCQKIGYGKSSLEFLTENHGYIIEKNGKLHPTIVTLLLFGKKPQDFLPRASVRFIRYEGTEEKTGTEMNVIKDVIFEGPVREQIDKSVAFLATQIKERTYLGADGKFVTEAEYPEFVRQEMIVNACCHRDLSITGTDIQVKLFDDKLVVESPGNLPGLVRPDNIRHTHFSRNPRLARYLKTYKYVKEFGEGVDRMCREMEADGLLPIKYYKNDFILRAVAWSKNAKVDSSDKVAISSDKVAISSDKVAIKWSEVKEKCSPNTIKILEHLVKNASISNAIAREITGLSSPGVRKILNGLVETKIVTPEGEKKSRVYHLKVDFTFD